MINLNQSYKMPKKVLFAYIVKIILLVFFLSFPLMFLNLKIWLLMIMILTFFMILAFISLYLDYYFFSFMVSENTITINRGMIIKRSKSIPFDKVQNVSTVSGIIARLFGLAAIKIWTTSPSQIIGITKEREFEAAPDGRLVLEKEDAEWLKNFITKK